MGECYDYVIVGGGSAGCVLAGRLSEDPGVTVCLIEAGPDDRSVLVDVPMGILPLLRSRKRNWCFETAPQPRLDGRRLYWPRGKMLGGSSAINAMVYIRGHAWDYDHWATLGNRGWSYGEILPLFKRSQNQERGASDFHGSGGPLNVADLRSPNPLSDVFVEAASQVQHRRNDDFNGASQEGVGLYQVTQKDGKRWSSARAFLAPAEGRSNLTIVTGARATRIRFAGKRAVGVDYARRGESRTVETEREVLLCGGAVNSPQLLLLSGVGPPAEMAPHGIAVVHDLPGVGGNLQDHLDITLVQRSPLRLSYGFALSALPANVKGLIDYIRRRRGMLTSNFAEAGGFIRSEPARQIPDIQFHFLPAMINDHGRKIVFGYGYSVHACGLRPESRGHIGLQSADPLADPLIEPNYLDHEDDMATLVRAFRAAREIFAAPAFDPHRGAELFPGEAVRSDEDIRRFIRQRAETIYHPVGSCKMGRDDMAVVDDTLAVHGLEGLRVVDASIMPTLVGGNTNAPTIMIAEKATEMIRASRAS